MKYILDIDLLKGYEEIAIKSLDEIVKALYDRGMVIINKQEKIGEPFFELLEKKLKE